MRIPGSLSEIVAYRKQRSHRIEALADAVFAIVMTLLVLDIRIPVVEMDTENGVWRSLLNILPKIFTFMLSFSVAGQFWSIFINQFNYLHTADRNESIIALFFLMFVSLLPFTTSFLSEHLWSRVAVGLYILNILLILSLNTLHWLYCFHSGLVKAEEGATIAIHKAILCRARAAYIFYGVVIVCCFINSYLALCTTILVHVLFKFSGLIETANAAWNKKTNSPNNLNTLQSITTASQVEVNTPVPADPAI